MPPYPLYLTIRGAAAFAGTTAWTLVILYQIQSAGLNPLQLVLVGTVMEITCFLAQVPTGIIADLYSRRLSIIVGYVLVGAGIMIQAIPEFGVILLGNVVWGIGITCIEGAEEAWATDEIGEERAGHVFTRGAQVGQLATVLGIGASVGLASIQLNLPLIVGGAIPVMLGLVLIAVMPERHFHRAPAQDRTTFHAMRDQLVEGGRAVRTRPVLLALLGAMFFLGLSSEGIDRLSQAHLLESFTFPSIGTPEIWFGAMGIVAMLGSVVLTEVVRRRVDVLQPRRVGQLLIVLQTGSAAAVLAFALAGQFWLAVACSLVAGLLGGVAGPLYTTWVVSQSESRTRATVFSLVGQANAAGQVLGGPPVGWIGTRFSIRWALGAAGLVVVPAIALYGVAVRRQRRTVADEPPVPESV